nr:preprotein translocase subunit SecE [Candidatus Woesebacteria bacterium]
RYFREVVVELKKVTWPKKSEVAKLTATVIILSAIVGLYLGGLDVLFTSLLSNAVTR